MDAMTEQDEKCKGCVKWNGSYGEEPCKRCSRVFSGMTKDYYDAGITATVGEFKQILPGKFTMVPSDEEDYLTKLIDDHWAYVEQVLVTHGNAQDVDIVKFHYTTAFRHGWKHAMEYMEGKG